MSGHLFSSEGDPPRAGGGAPAAPARVRAVRPEEVPALWEEVRALAEYERLTERLTGDAATLARHLFGEPPLVHARVAERDGRLVGYAIWYFTYSSFRTRPILWLEDLFVRPSERGRGTGRALFVAVAREARRRGCLRLSWEVLGWNDLAIGFYEQLGARRDEGGWHHYHLHADALETLAADPSPGA